MHHFPFCAVLCCSLVLCCALFCWQGSQAPDVPATSQMSLLEQLLWHGDIKQGANPQGTQQGNTSGSGSSGSAAPASPNVPYPSHGSSISTWLQQLLVRFVLGRLDVQLLDCRCQFVAPWQLGPSSLLAPHAQQGQHCDGVALALRSLAVQPGAGAGVGGGTCQADAASQGASLREAAGEHGGMLAWPAATSGLLCACCLCVLCQQLATAMHRCIM